MATARERKQSQRDSFDRLTKLIKEDKKKIFSLYVRASRGVGGLYRFYYIETWNGEHSINDFTWDIANLFGYRLTQDGCIRCQDAEEIRSPLVYRLWTKEELAEIAESRKEDRNFRSWYNSDLHCVNMERI